MKSFLQFLQEMPGLLTHYPKERSRIPKGEKHTRVDPLVGTEYKKISTLANHNVMHTSIDLDSHTFRLVNPRSKQVIMQLNTTMGNNGAHIVHNLKGMEGSPVKAHELYTHLLQKGHISTLYSDSAQSPGGQRTWEHLAKNPNIEIKHVGHNGSEAPLDRENWNNNYDTPAARTWKTHSRFVARWKGNQ